MLETAKSPLDLRSRILSSITLKEEPLHVPEWNADLTIRELTGKERAQFFTSISDPKTGRQQLDKFYADLCILSVIDPATGKRLFDVADRDSLNAGSGTALERVAQVAKRVSGLSDEDLADSQKNSESIPSSSTLTN